MKTSDTTGIASKGSPSPKKLSRQEAVLQKLESGDAGAKFDMAALTRKDILAFAHGAYPCVACV